MTELRKRRATALQAIGNALLELAAIERESADGGGEMFINRKNSESELGLASSAFRAAAGLHFPAFRVSRRLTAKREDVLAWLTSRTMTKSVPSRKPMSPRWDASMSFDETVAYIEAGTTEFERRARRMEVTKGGGDPRTTAVFRTKVSSKK